MQIIPLRGWHRVPERMKAWQPGKCSVPLGEGEGEPGRAESIPSSSCPPWELPKGKTRLRPPPNSPSCLRGVCHYSHSKEKVWTGRESALPGADAFPAPPDGMPTIHPQDPSSALTLGPPWPCPSMGPFNNPITPSFPSAPSKAFSLALFITLLCIPLNSNNTNRGSAAIVASKMFTPGSL